MEGHKHRLCDVCRICGQTIKTNRRSKQLFQAEIIRLCSADISNDDDSIHPPYVCPIDAAKLYRVRKCNPSSDLQQLGCFPFVAHSDTGCRICHPASDMFKHSYSRTPKYERQGPTKRLRSQEEDDNVRDVDLIKEVFLTLSSSDKITCLRQLCEHISETQRTELVGYFGSLVGDDMERTRCSNNASHMKEINNFSAFDVSTYIKQQPPALVNFICAVSKVSLERVNTNQRLAYQIAVVCEQLIRLSMPHYVGPVSFLQNLNVLAITSSKLALNIIGSSIPGGNYNTVCNWFAEQGSSSLQCPTGDIVIMFDNEQIIGRTWSIKPQSKIKTSIITNVAALPLTAETSLQKRSDLHPRKWLNDEAKKAHADGIIIGQGDNKHERIHYQQLFLFIEAALEDVINEQNKENNVCTDKIDVIVEARRSIDYSVCARMLPARLKYQEVKGSAPFVVVV